MNNKKLFMVSALAASMTVGMAQDDETPVVYGWLSGETWAAQNGVESRCGLASFPVDQPTEVSVSLPLQYDNKVATAVYHDGLWYYIEYAQTYSGYESIGFNSLDPETGDITVIADFGSAAQGPIACSLMWSYADQKMYGLNGLQSGTGLVSIDLETGDIKLEHLFYFDQPDGENNSNYRGTMKAIAETYDGDMYGVAYWGGLYKINKNTGECKRIGKLDYLGEVTSYSGTALQYPNTNFFFDEDRGQWYLQFYSYPYPAAGYAIFMKVDITTGKTSDVYTCPLAPDFMGLHIPFQIAEASAPGKVTDFTLTPGENGALSATLDWYNPAKTYGRGGTLLSLDSVVVYRDGEAIKTFTGVAPGEHLTLVDEVPESRFYSYRIQGFNEAGAGDRKALSSFIGHDTPKAVTNITVESDDTADHKITVSWTAPTEGIYDGWIDADNLSYRVVRSDGDTVYSDLKETSFVDAPASMASYTYSITAITPDGESAAAVSPSAIGGPAILLPHTFTFTAEDFALWTVYDNNGDEVKWQPTSQYAYKAIYPGIYVGYSYYYGYSGADWAISPAIKFEAGKHYKLTFDAQSYNASQPECLAITIGESAAWAVQDSIDQFEFASGSPVELRTNLPVFDEDCERHIGFYARSYYQGWQMSVGNARIEEDHDGSLTGKVTDAATGEFIPLAKVTATNADGFMSEIWTNPANGVYTFKYVPSGEVNITIERMGYADLTGSAIVTEFETTTADFEMEALPRRVLSGTVVDKVNDPVVGATITLEGYNEYMTTTDAEGCFKLENIMANENYNLTITSNRLEAYQNVQPMTEDVELGTITLDDKILPPAQIKAELNEEGVPSLTWSNPVNDDVTLRYDANLITNSLGTSQSSSYAVFGNIFRTPGLYRGAQFYLESTSQTIYGVDVCVFDLDESGEPTTDIIARKYISVTQGAWNTMTFNEPVSAPRGCYIALQYYGFLGIGISEPNDSYPFVEHVSCYTGDYTTGQFFYLESAGYPNNFMLRAVCAPYEQEEAKVGAFISTEVKAEADAESPAAKNLMDMKRIEALPVREPAVKMNAIGDRTWFDLYRLTPSTVAESESWIQLLDSVSQRSFVDEAIKSLPMGTYEYAVRCHYVDGLTSSFVLSDTIGWQMHTTVTVKLNTNTPNNEAEGAWVQIVNGGGVHAYGDYADENGVVVFENVWKANYDLMIKLNGFDQVFEVVSFETEDAYTIERQLTETQVTPFGLQVINDDDDVEEDSGNRLFIWNFPDQIFEGFEDHEAFSIDSPGEIGWQYLDFDDPSEGTGFFNDMSYPNQGGSFAYQVFNLSQVQGNAQSYSYYFSAYQGQQMLASWANSTDQNWLVSPRLFFNEDFKFAFYAKGYGYQTESFMVGYTTSKDWTDTESYTWLEYVPVYAWEVASEIFKVNSYWTRYSFDIPADANYVTIRQVDGNYVFMLDNICIGLPEGFPSLAPARKAPVFRAPSLDGAYKVYLDGELVGQTDDKQFSFENLDGGYHTAGVISSYTSGDTEMSTIEFYVDKEVVGIENINANAVKANAYDLQGRRTNSRQGIIVAEGQKQLRK